MSNEVGVYPSSHWGRGRNTLWTHTCHSHTLAYRQFGVSSQAEETPWEYMQIHRETRAWAKHRTKRGFTGSSVTRLLPLLSFLLSVCTAATPSISRSVCFDKWQLFASAHPQGNDKYPRRTASQSSNTQEESFHLTETHSSSFWGQRGTVFYLFSPVS